MKQLVLILSITSLLLFGIWGCPDKTEQSKKATIGSGETIEKKVGEPGEPVQADTGSAVELAKEKAKDVIEELQTTAPGSKEETKGLE